MLGRGLAWSSGVMLFGGDDGWMVGGGADGGDGGSGDVVWHLELYWLIILDTSVLG